MKKQVLMIGFSDDQGRKQRRKLKEELAERKIGIAVRPVPEADYDRTLGDLVGLATDSSAPSGLPSAGLSRLSASSPDKAAPFASSFAADTRLLVLCGLDGTEQDLMLSLFSDVGITKEDLKAILTPANARWTVQKLADALQKEHDRLNKS